MPLPPVAVEVVPPLKRAELLSTLLKACSQAVLEADCVSAGREPTREPPSAVAIVSVEGNRVRVEVGVKRSGQSQWMTRELRFGATDPDPERFKTVGFVIGTLAGEVSEELSQNPTAGQGVEAYQTAPPPSEAADTVHDETETIERVEEDNSPFTESETASAPLAPDRRLWLDLAFVAGPGLREGAWRTGGEARVSAGLAGQVFTFAGGGFAWRAQDDQGISMTWGSGFVGLGTGVVHEAAFGSDARIAFEAVHVAAQFADAQRGVSADDAWIAGARVGLDLHYRFSDYLAAELSAEARWLSKGYDVILGKDGPTVALLPRVGFQFGAGFRLWP